MNSLVFIFRNSDKTTPWPKRIASSTSLRNPEVNNGTKNSTVNVTNKYNITTVIADSKANNITNDNNTALNITGNNTQDTSLLITKIMAGLNSSITTEDGIKKIDPSLPLCDSMPPDLGKLLLSQLRIRINFKR